MGSCSSQLMQKLSPQFGKYLAAQKGKQVVDKRIEQFKHNINKQVTTIKQQSQDQVNQQHNLSLQKIRNAVNQIDQKSPGALDKAAALQRKTKQSLLGQDQVNNKYKELHQSVRYKYLNKQQEIYTEVDDIGQQIKRYFDADKPDMPAYESLEQHKKRKIYSEGESLYSQDIKTQQQEAERQLQQNLNMNKYIHQLRNLQSSIEIDGITKQTDGIIANSKEGLTSTSLFC